MSEIQKVLIIPDSFKDSISAIEFCAIAKGNADVYPRFSPTMEWDIAAGHAILKHSGGSITDFENKEILYDDTKESVGSKLAKMDLIGIPFQVIIGPRLAKDNKYEFKNRSNGEKHIVDFDNLINLVNS